eukprot:CAMPEP_0171391188 /NCGR_PEP_ID=MMETSP0880-20121228/1079_1 /TAXON_ID=67004 /ORGANISM="Thalassiosira weissflogii, Strain CCMP1336" /LENGTH=208 /DNA_ID=CAMNT_0011903781 /DNA_START=1058 /DNA_END=1681 /DNA_ORIENTATION=-
MAIRQLVQISLIMATFTLSPIFVRARPLPAALFSRHCLKTSSHTSFIPLFQTHRQTSTSATPIQPHKAGPSAAYGRSTFRFVRDDADSWRLSSQSNDHDISHPDDNNAATTTTPPSPTTSHDLTPYRNKNNLDDQVFSAISSCGGLKVTVATMRNLLNEMMIQHSMNPVPADALGRATICALLASNGMQEEQMFQLTLKGDGPLRGCF